MNMNQMIPSTALVSCRTCQSVIHSPQIAKALIEDSRQLIEVSCMACQAITKAVQVIEEREVRE